MDNMDFVVMLKIVIRGFSNILKINEFMIRRISWLHVLLLLWAALADLG